jgi:uronate dehydrogenase
VCAPSRQNNSENLKILVTGAAGAVGSRVVEALLERGHCVRGLDIRKARVAVEHITKSVTDLQGLRVAAAGMDVIVHTAGVPERQEFGASLVPNNIVGTHNVFEVARLEGVKRVVNTSSVRVVGGLDWGTGRIGLEQGFVPGDHYGISKVTGEVIGEMYSRRFGIAVVSVRLGWFVRNQAEADAMASLPMGKRIYISHDDAKDFYVRAIERPGIEHAVVYVTSLNSEDSAFDLEPARRIFGYAPKDTFPSGSSWSESEDFPSPVVGPSLAPQ